MNIEEALTDYLVDTIGLEVIPMPVDEGAILPLIAYARISLMPVQHRSSMRPLYGRLRFQIEGWGRSMSEAITTRESILAAMGAFTRASDPRVDATLLKDSRLIVEPEAKRYRASLDYFILCED